jgi:pyruvate dehydrogenase E1 component alpha subunit
MEHNGFTKEKLLEFSKEIAKYYEEGKIKSPIHLHGGGEDKLISIFKENNINENDWIFSTHRSHYHWLLSGRNPEELKTQILEGHSMHIFDHKFFTSAIVGGSNPIALGVAKALLMKGSKHRVYCFTGDMASTGGLFKECLAYAEGWDLPILYIIENNGMSVRASTKATWGLRNGKNKVVEYEYERKYQHAGSSKEGEERKYVMF